MALTVIVKHQDGTVAPGQKVCLDQAGVNCKTTDANGKATFSPTVGAHHIFVNASDCCTVNYTGMPAQKTCTIP
jgi:hypothetical protein